MILPDLVVIQPQHSQILKLPNPARDVPQAVVVQQELLQRPESSHKRHSVQAAAAQAVVGETERLEARPQVAEDEGGDVTDVVVVQGQFVETSRKIHGDGGELVVGQVQSFKGSENKTHQTTVNLSQI